MAAPHLEKHVFVCTNRREAGDPKGCCADKGGDEVRDAFKRILHERGMKGRIRANAAGCLDQCARGVAVVVYPEQVWYGGVTAADVPEIIERHLEGGVPVERLRLK
ncbi:MAG: (2Fe-2S) ferredoxin domain-containing protein [Bacteroidota bacterium]